MKVKTKEIKATFAYGNFPSLVSQNGQVPGAPVGLAGTSKTQQSLKNISALSTTFTAVPES
jgi:hypothetical protein